MCPRLWVPENQVEKRCWTVISPVMLQVCNRSTAASSNCTVLNTLARCTTFKILQYTIGTSILYSGGASMVTSPLLFIFINFETRCSRLPFFLNHVFSLLPAKKSFNL